MPKLTVRKVETVKKPGEYGDGEGLILLVGPTGCKSWVLRTVVHGKRRRFGLGSTSLVGLAEAREQARELRKIARAGGDPESVRKKRTLTFWDAAQEVHGNLLPTWKNAKHAETWLSTVENYAKPAIGDRPIESVDQADMLAILAPIWVTKHETAKRLKQRLGTIMDWAKGAGHYSRENPINGVGKALPTVRRRKEHLGAMPWQEVPAFMAELAERPGVSARTLEYIILTASRSGEARGALWPEVEGTTWTVPAERMKSGVEHRVPLPPEAMEVLEKMRGFDADFVFPSQKRGPDGETRPQSVMVFKSLLKRMGRGGFTVHGFRSSFRDWCSERGFVEREVAEAALSHATGDAVEQAYARSDLFERRRAAMQEWARFATGKSSGKVVKIA